MKINNSKKLEKVVSKNTHQSLNKITFKDKKLYASNGDAMAIIYPLDAENDVEGSFSVDCLKAARQANTSIHSDGGGLVLGNGARFPSTPVSDIDFSEIIPNWKDTPEFEIKLDVKLLKNLADALGETQLVFKFHDKDSVVVVETKGEDFGLIMPMRLDSKEVR